MTQQTRDKSATIDELYSRIRRNAEEMSGIAERVLVPISLASAIAPTSRSANVPALHVAMPNGLRAEFIPTALLDTPYVLCVQIRRTLHGSQKSDCTLSFGPNGSRGTKTPMSDDENREYLTP
jgi:hypothetical protein